MSQSIDDPNHLARHSNILLTLKLFVHLFCVLYETQTIRPIAPRLLQGLRGGAHGAVSILVYPHIPLIIVRKFSWPVYGTLVDAHVLDARVHNMGLSTFGVISLLEIEGQA